MLVALVVPGLQAQQAGGFATSDQKVYITGETIWVSGKVAETGGDAGVTIYLFNREGVVVEKMKVLAEGGIFFGGIAVKERMPTENYVIGVLQGGRFRSFLPVMIINPVIPAPYLRAEASVAGKETSTPKSLGISLSTAEITIRSELAVQVDSPAAGLDYFISVHRQDMLSLYADSLFAGWSYTDNRTYGNVEGNTIRVMARVTDGKGAPVTGIPVLSAFWSNQADLGYAVSDDNGRVVMVHPAHYTNPSVVLTPMDGNSGIRIQPEIVADSFQFAFSLPVMELTERFAADLNERVTHATADRAFRPEMKTSMLTERVDTTDFYGIPDKRYMLDNYVRFPDMQEILQEFIPEVRVRRNDGKAFLQVVNLPFKVFFEQPALVLLDGVPVTDIDQLLQLDPLRIQSIDVVARKFFLGQMQMHGIVHYKTYKTDLAGYKLPAGQLVSDYQGMSLPMVPAYLGNGALRIPDFRNTLYWRKPGPLSKGRFQCFSQDAPGQYRIQVYGIDRAGNLYQGQRSFLVK
jgi:hypothetical protein